jgi:hypothetical protein
MENRFHSKTAKSRVFTSNLLGKQIVSGKGECHREINLTQNKRVRNYRSSAPLWKKNPFVNWFTVWVDRLDGLDPLVYNVNILLREQSIGEFYKDI